MSGVDRIASHPDAPAAPLADRLLLALGMWPSYVDELGADVVVDAGAIIKSAAHRYPMVCEDWGQERELREQLVTALRSIEQQLVEDQGEEVRALGTVREALSWVDGVDDEPEEEY